MKISSKLATLAAILALGSTGFSHAQQAPKSKGAPHQAQTGATPASPQADAAPANTPAPPGWAARCTSASREAPLECVMEQTAVLSKTGS